ncbi:MAG TPA: type VI secretion system protein TssL, long form [Bosea sp. (in: a-proteobacteria)]|jgi:type VI secretion system protein ImpK|uniref:type VI secretion system protein TssL, long form n=1 Tax=Bosea sp. (in: a-proteobacteria) TaxID=1871050 RepID=UPI002DDD6A4A|nr:type VI secretion system protein TssL, long form [Bosea sp. (in: a-proteobacteria)]HEV2555677.1 type VI secretion system protein TssL, long form [Bosea sp. (in: a-proteobacteria)]
MSDPGSPSDPFGRSDRTIIRPNPAGRRAPLPSRPATPAAPTPYAPPAAASPGVPGGSDDWISASQPAPPRPAPPPGPAAGPLPGRDQLLTPNANPLLRAAGPLLLLLGRLRSQLSSAPLAQLLGQVTETIEAFEHEVRAAGASAEQTRTAKYVLCAAADDIVQNIPGEDRHVWTQYSMLSKFFGERVGGVRFFEELDRAKADPSVNYDLLELMHACLALGFQGIHRTSAGGAANLQMIQRNLFETLRRVKQPDPELSPRWRGQAVASQVARFRVPVWSVAALAGVAVLGLYLVFRALLGGNAEAAASALLSVHPKGELGLVRKVFSAPPPPLPPPPVPPKVCGAVQPPIVCQVTPNVIIVRLVDITLFEPGQAAVRAEFKPLIERIAAVLETEGGAVKVVGHTDNVPIRTARFASNLQLSQARAKAVGDLLQTKLSKPDRISVEGKGADVPIAPNTTREGRAKNRRVEILIQRQG